ncbi:hypothetical protein [Cytobacillus gottheilii]|uniref:Uncharacterized protein n=1 Tax=Cytobacillus gottheilii TaxID=859144 RepID=A0ABX8FIZ0_9BACI|nr:hypothetical protein [Cytobacillus gottheilii]QVY63944.1 hypothetical protein J1899_22485 [Cytobacillus gottheilii]
MEITNTKKGNIKSVTTGILVGSFLTLGILYFTNSALSNQTPVNEVWYQKEVAETVTDYMLVLNDLKDDKTSNDYAAVLIERDIEHLIATMTAGNDLFNQDALSSIENMINNMKTSSDLILANEMDQLTYSVKDLQTKLSEFEVAIN